MVKITEKSLEEKASDQKTAVMFEMANLMFRDVHHEWAASHPHNVKQKYIIERWANHPSGMKADPGVVFSFWAVKPVNFVRRHEQLTRVIDIYAPQNKITVSNSQYLDDAVKLAESYEKFFTHEFTVEKDYA